MASRTRTRAPQYFFIAPSNSKFIMNTNSIYNPPFRNLCFLTPAILQRTGKTSTQSASHLRAPCQRIRVMRPRTRRVSMQSEQRSTENLKGVCDDSLEMVKKYARDIQAAEQLLRTCEFELPSGTAALAKSRGVDMGKLSRAYGRVIAESVKQNVPIKFDIGRFVEGFMAGGTGEEVNEVEMLVFEAWMGIVRRKMEEKADCEIGGEEVGVMCEAYGGVLGRSVRLSGFEWEFEGVVEGIEEWMEGKGKVVMSDGKYNEMYEVLADCAATVLGTSRLDSAEKFFTDLRGKEGVRDVQGDGYVLGVWGEWRNDQVGAKCVELGSRVKFGLRIRLLEGRALLVPEFETEKWEIQVAVDQLPVALMCVMIGMKEGESRSAFFHPFAAPEMLELVATLGELPQAGLVVDIFLTAVD